MPSPQAIRAAYEKNGGILRMIPNWVPRPASKPGRRLRLHPDDYYRLGLNRGSITERWFSSLVPALNGPLTAPGEGLSRVALSADSGDEVFFRDIVAALGAEMIGAELHDRYGTWPMYAKFFDNEWPLEHHLHLDDAHAAKVGMLGKPEAYYFPAQMNNHPGTFPITYFGFDPDMDRDEVKKRLLMFEAGDNRITELSRGYRIELGTGWYTPPGVVHAPGSYLTYEPQWNSDVGACLENVLSGGAVSRDRLVQFLPDAERNDIESIMDMIDWDANVDPHYRQKYFRPPVPVETGSADWSEKWITYANPYFAAKETTVNPGADVVVKDRAAYGCVILQGHGSFGGFADAEAAVMLRYGQRSGDEYFVGATAARAGVRIVNRSSHEPMVIVRHFGPDSGAPERVPNA